MLIFYAFSLIGYLYFVGYFTPDSDQLFPIGHFICLFGYINFLLTTSLALNGQYNTPLTCAIFNGNVEIVKILLLHDAQENYPATSLITPFFVASLYGRSEISNILLEKSPRLIDQEHSKCCTPMAAAVLCCNKPVRWRLQDRRSIFKFYFGWGVIAFTMLFSFHFFLSFTPSSKMDF